MNVKQARCFMVTEPGGTKQFYLEGPDDVMDLLTNELHLDSIPVEQFYALYLNVKNKVTAYELISQGNLSCALVSPTAVFRGAVLNNAASFIVAHNHPSGDPTPSKEDLRVTSQLKTCGELMGIKLIDHIIVGSKNSYTSIKEIGGM